MPGNRISAVFLASCLPLLLFAQATMAQTPVESSEEVTEYGVALPRFGGPDSVENLLESAQSEKDVLIESSIFEGFFE